MHKIASQNDLIHLKEYFEKQNEAMNYDEFISCH